MSTGIAGTTRLNGARVGSKSGAKWVGPAKLVIATQQEFTAAGIEALLLAGGHRVLARCTCWDDLLLSLTSNRPDTLLLNLVRREAAGLISQLRADHRSMSIILMLDERDAITAASLLELDVEGILLGAACASSLLQCVESVCDGRRWVDPNLLRHLALAERTAQIASRLTRREADIANLISRGLHNKQIARELHVSEGTVKMHLHHIYEKLHLRSRTELALSVTIRAEDDLISGQHYAPTAKASS
ncbi:two component transcriptional regulator, LuxR family [Rhodospirillales bacterium URHD0017]|nr:two component transcriptional regulator, LuxR family [Rhodospirillales bacterium URHD0017]